ncbi:FliG C-terminal domain-containing protein, partial [Stenotrophomonas sp. 2YAF22]
RGPVRLSDVEVAQREILAIVKRMADEGTVTIGGSAEAML